MFIMFIYVYHCLLVQVYLLLAMFPNVYKCLPMFTTLSHVDLFTTIYLQFFYLCLTMVTRLPMFNSFLVFIYVYNCLKNICAGLPMFSHVH